MTSLAKDFGMSANGLAKICDRVDIDRPPKGYWANPYSQRTKPHPNSISDPDLVIEIGGRKRGARRSQSRMTREQRQEQIMESARNIISKEGAHFVSLRRIARELGISEAQAYNCFETRHVLLVEIATRELDTFAVKRAEVVSRGNNRLSKVIMSTLAYLEEASERGSLVTNLMALSDVRKEIELKRSEITQEIRKKQVNNLVEDRRFSFDEALVRVALFNNLTLRAGGLVSNGKLSKLEAQTLILPPIIKAATQLRSD